jgi:hypothetical protein
MLFSQRWLERMDGMTTKHIEDFWRDATDKHVARVMAGETVEGPNGDRIKCVEPGFEQRHYALKVGDTISTPSGRQAIVTEHGIEVS